MRNNYKKAQSEIFDNNHRISGNTLLKIVYKCITVYNGTHNYPIPPEDIDVVASNIYTKVYTNEGKFDPTRSPLGSWVYTIASNCINDYWDDRSRRENWGSRNKVKISIDTECADAHNYEPDDDSYNCSSSTSGKMKTIYDLSNESDFESGLIEQEEYEWKIEWLDEHVKLLSDRRRFVFEEIRKGTEREEIARKLGCTTGAVYNLLNKAIEVLRNMYLAEHQIAA
jgi:RNA polymerase sigma factor (sigma-70 family)